MSVAERLAIIPARALEDPSLRQADICVLAAIGSHTSTDGGLCWASAKTLSREAHVSLNQFFLSAKRLIAAGLIAREKSGQAKGQSSHYSIVFQQAPGTPATGMGGTPATGMGGVSGVPATGVGPPRQGVRGRNAHRYGPTMNSPSNNSIKEPRALGSSTSDLKRRPRAEHAAAMSELDAREQRIIR